MATILWQCWNLRAHFFRFLAGICSFFHFSVWSGQFDHKILEISVHYFGRSVLSEYHSNWPLLKYYKRWNHRLAVLFPDKLATLEANGSCTCSLASVTFWYWSSFRNKTKQLFSKRIAYLQLEWLKSPTLSPFSIKHLLPSEVKLALGRATRLYSTTNR